MTRLAERRRAAHGALLLSLSLAACGRADERDDAAREEPARYSGSRTLLDRASQMPEARLAAPVRVAIVRDPVNRAFYAEPDAIDSATAAWQRTLRAAGAEVRVVGDVANGAAEADVLLLTHAPCMGEPARRALERALADGRGVILTTFTATRDAGCRASGWSVATSLTGAGRVDTLEVRDEVYVTLPFGGPLATDIPAGSRLELLVAPHVALRAAGRDGYYSDFLMNPMPARGAPLLDAALVHAEHGGGRVVYWGFELSHVAPSAWNQALAARLVRNSVAWAAGQPLPAVEPWPRGHVAAAALAQDVEDLFGNARHALDTLRAAGVRGTYFLVTDLAMNERELVRELADHGEIGTHTDDHRLLGGADRASQTRRLGATQRHVRTLVGRDAAGLRPPEEQFDDATMVEWVRNGGTYLFGANNARTASPEVLSVDGRRLVLLGRVVDDDFATVRRAGMTDPDLLSREYLTAYRKVRALGGLYVLSYHSNLLARAELVPALGQVARALRADTSVWLTTAGEAAEWWSRRADVRLTTTRQGDALELVAHNGGRRAVDGAVARLHVSDRVTGVEGASLMASDAGVVRLALPTLAPDARHVVRLRLGGAR